MKITIFNGKTHYFYGHYNSFLYVYQRVLKANATQKNRDGLGGNLKKKEHEVEISARPEVQLRLVTNGIFFERNTGRFIPPYLLVINHY